MIPLGTGWHVVARGSALCLTPPEGAGCGAIRYDERRRPLQPVATLLATMQAGEPGFVAMRQRGPEPLTTHEGEYAALVVQEGFLRGSATPVQRSIGYVFGDDFYACIDGLALREDQFVRFEDEVRRLVQNDRHFLGLRRRRFRFQPPTGYFGVERTALHAYYYAPGFPRDPTVIVVYPATPRVLWHGDDLTQHLRPLQGLCVHDVSGPFLRQTATLSGDTWTLHGTDDDGRAMTRTIVVLHDDRYVYPLSLDTPSTPAAEPLARFAAVVESVQRLPGLRGAALAPAGDSALGHWG